MPMYKRFIDPLIQAEKRIEEYRSKEQWKQMQKEQHKAGETK